MKIIRRSDLETVLSDRGYTWEEIWPCVIRVRGEIVELDENHKAYPKDKKGLGDLIAGGLKSVGITEERVKKFTGRKECGCKKRRERLNKIGKAWGIG